MIILFVFDHFAMSSKLIIRCSALAMAVDSYQIHFCRVTKGGVIRIDIDLSVEYSDVRSLINKKKRIGPKILL